MKFFKDLPKVPVHPLDDSSVESLYHLQAIGQASVQFWFGIAAASVGFVLIVYACLGHTPDFFVGIIFKAVGQLYFRQSSEAQKRATALYDRYRVDKKLRFAVSLVSSIIDKNLKSLMQAQIASHLAGITPPPINVSKQNENLLVK